jgi:predicted phosphoadenosine phosphosulfate sulfurtransferase
LEYVQTWQHRCYSAGIPDEVPNKVAASGRAPSWRAVAIALLKNDLNLYGLGFSMPCWRQQQQTIAKASIATIGTFPKNHQLELFNETNP